MRKSLGAICFIFVWMFLAVPPVAHAGQDLVCEMNKKGYENNMVVYGTVHLQGELAGKTTVLLAKGVNGEDDCRAKSVIETNGFFYVTIAGSTNGEAIRFVILDVATGKLKSVTGKISFQADATVADFDIW